MKDLKEGIQSSVFPVKLFVVYVLWLTFFTGLIDGPIACVFSLGAPHPEDIAESFAMMLALSPALLAVFILAVWNFRRIPVFGICSTGFALWLLWVIWSGYWPGFETDFPNYFHMTGLLFAASFFAVPFVLMFIAWRIWPHKDDNSIERMSELVP